ncbi:CSK1 [Candida jiufengensis]|uniref:CSK1 n=1 Tax=Candida jiufengensis TaxID=497108 RepID=UPI002224ECBD|nr:CSK1 [Candida jiufengensis]KAI5951925.1 CSK1 [Candida jiufengensis]
MKLDDLYTNKTLIYNSPFSDICKVKPIPESPYITENQKTKQYVVLKIVDLDFKIPPHSITRELEVLKKLQHHQKKDGYVGIIEYLNDFQIIDDKFLVLDFYPFTLNQLIQTPKYMSKTLKFGSIDEKGDMKHIIKNKINNSDIKIFLQNLINSIKFIHSNEIIHRDLKPSNIFFKDDDITQPIIGDFGCCYNLQNPPEDEPFDLKYVDISSSIYKSPELLLGITNYSYEVDYWSIGIILTILYSKNFKSILIKNENELNNDSQINDLHLLVCIFKTFGTPTYLKEDENDENLYWPELNNDDLHFKKFNLQKLPRLSISEILPNSNDEYVEKLFSNLIRYDRSKRKMYIED